MTAGNYILIDKSFVPFAEYRVSLKETEGFLFAEKIRSIRTNFPFFRETLELIEFKLQLFHHSNSELTSKDGEGLKRQLERTLTKNKHFLGAILTIRFWVAEQKLHFSIHSAKCDNIGFEMNTNGLYVSVFHEIKKSICTLSNSSLGSEAYWKIAGYHPKESFIDEILLLNTQDQIVEAIGSNVYLIRCNEAKGASVIQGAFADITQPLMLKIFDHLKLKYDDSNGITEDDLKNANEILLVNAIDGIRWVVGYEGKRYFNHTARKINELFIKSLTN